MDPLPPPPVCIERFKEAVIDERRISAVAMLKFASCKDYLTQPLSQFTEVRSLCVVCDCVVHGVRDV